MDYKLPRCRVEPLADYQVAFVVDGTERLRWHFGPSYPRPFFFPLNGPSGSALTRMGHPGADNHDHHRSIWFAHQKVLGIDFWSDRTEARIRQRKWLVYDDGDSEAAMAVEIGWYDGHDPQELLVQELIAAVRPGPDGETLLELQSTFRPKAESLEFGKTNFGFLAIRVAKSLSEYFGGGRLTSSTGKTGEPDIFGEPAQWMDYSGPVPGAGDAATVEGITYFDHPQNPGQPTRWHVREDGWIGASVCREESQVTTQKQPLVARYLVHAHSGAVHSKRADKLLADFSERPRFLVERSQAKHRQYELRRA